MTKKTKNLLIVGGVAALLLVSNAATFVVASYTPARSAIWTAIARIWFPEGEALRNAQEQTVKMLEVQDWILPVDDQKRIMKRWYDLRIWDNTEFLGIPVMKSPLDLWMMQSVITEVKPDYIVEAGTANGGSALYWAATLDLLGLEDSRVITIDIVDYTADAARSGLWQNYVQFIQASSTDPETVDSIARQVEGKTVMVMLDSDHAAEHVLQELRLYGPLVSPGSYLVVEDTQLDGIPVSPQFELGPMSALLEYLDSEGADLYEQDLSRDAYVLTQNPGGWLRRRSH